jgi:hypothetical protein
MAPIGIASAQIAANRSVTSMISSAADDSSALVPALVARLRMTATQVEQIRSVAAQYRSQRQPIVAQMADARAASDSPNGDAAAFLQRLQDLDRAQAADIVAILTPSQLSVLRQMEQGARTGAGIISRQPAIATEPR